MSLLPSNRTLKGDWAILSFSSSKKWFPMQLAIAAVFYPKWNFSTSTTGWIFLLIKGAKWSLILKNVLCCTRFNSGNARIPRYWPSILFFLQITDTFSYSLNKGDTFSKQNAYKYIHVQFMLTLSYLVVTKRSHILKQTCRWKPQVCWSTCDIFCCHQTLKGELFLTSSLLRWDLVYS